LFVEHWDISTIIPAYNAETFLSRAIESVLAQTFPSREIIVVDDGSTDRTADVAASFGDRIRYVPQDNAGAAAARNHGISLATSEWIATLDSDDWWVLKRLEWAVETLEQHPQLQWASGGFTTVLPGGRQVVHPSNKAYRSLLEDGCYFPNFYEAARLGVRFNSDNMVIRKSVMVDAGLFDASMTTSEDLDLWYRIADRFPAIGYIDRPISFYDRSHESSLTRNKEMISRDYLRLLGKRIRPGAAPSGGKDNPREAFFRWRIGCALRLAVVRGEKDIVCRILDAYPKWLSLTHRTFGLMLRLVPSAVLAAGSGCYRTLVRVAGRIRRRGTP